MPRIYPVPTRSSAGILPVVAILGLLVCYLPHARAQGTQPTEVKEIQLITGDDFTNWIQEFHPRHRERAAKENLKAFSMEDGVLHADGSLGNVGFLRYTREFCDFELQTEFRAAPGANNGICFRAPPYDKETPAHTGYELQILLRDDVKPDSATGSLYSVNPSQAKVSLAPNQWHTARIVARGPRIQAWVNGTLVQDFDQNSAEATRSRPRCGYISVQNHGGDTDFRNMRVRPLP